MSKSTFEAEHRWYPISDILLAAVSLLRNTHLRRRGPNYSKFWEDRTVIGAEFGRRPNLLCTFGGASLGRVRY